MALSQRQTPRCPVTAQTQEKRRDGVSDWAVSVAQLGFVLLSLASSQSSVLVVGLKEWRKTSWRESGKVGVSSLMCDRARDGDSRCLVAGRVGQLLVDGFHGLLSSYFRIFFKCCWRAFQKTKGEDQYRN